MLSPAELDSMREDAEASLGSTCNIVTVEKTRDARGNVTDVTVTGPDFVCAVDPIDVATEVEVVAQINVTQAYRISMPLAVIVSEADRIGVDVEGFPPRILRVLGPGGMQTDASLRSVIATESE